MKPLAFLYGQTISTDELVEAAAVQADDDPRIGKETV